MARSRYSTPLAVARTFGRAVGRPFTRSMKRAAIGAGSVVGIPAASYLASQYSSPSVVTNVTPRSGMRTASNVARDLRQAQTSAKRLLRGGASMSKSAGFIGRRRVARRTTRRRNEHKLGVTFTIEKGGIVDSAVNNGSSPAVPQSADFGNTVCVGHNTVPAYLTMQMAWRAIIKRLFIMLGDGDFSDFEATVPELNAGDQILLKYYANSETDTLTDLYSGVIVGLSYDGIAKYFCDQLATTAGDQVIPYSLSFIPTNSVPRQSRLYKSILLSGCYLHFSFKSALKCQNRTVNTATGDEESVDNVPIYGRSYEGKGAGTGAITKDKRGTSFAAKEFTGDEESGTIAKVPSEKWYQEVPNQSQFLKVKKSFSAKLDPGQVKTSVLQHRLNISFVKLITLLNRYQFNGGQNHLNHPLGMYRFMIFEKMLTAVQGTEVNSIKLAYEVNLSVGCTAYCKKNFTTARMNDVYNFGNES